MNYLEKHNWRSVAIYSNRNLKKKIIFFFKNQLEKKRREKKYVQNDIFKMLNFPFEYQEYVGPWPRRCGQMTEGRHCRRQHPI